MSRRVKTRWLALIAGTIAALYGVNNSWSAAPPSGPRPLLAHRGVHQTFSREGLTNETCTAAQSHPIRHRFIENTIPSMSEAFRLGATTVEIDVHPTTDGEFVVFHDWTLDCRTNGSGVTRRHTLAQIQALDVGWGYTADGGRTYPLRGSGLGLAPSLEQVLREFPDRRFHINVKSNDPREAELLDGWLDARPWARPERLAVFGGPRPTARLRALRPEMVTGSKGDLKACARDYLLTGWTGRTPDRCRRQLVYVPAGWGWLLWGWPNRFVQRMEAAGSEVWLIGPPDIENRALPSLDDPADLARALRRWKGGIATDRIEVIGPLVRQAEGAREGRS
ncbi:MAG TPA: glycerophosphodiester phosphodiesterase family protein [Caulobacteraceae bacterium]